MNTLTAWSMVLASVRLLRLPVPEGRPVGTKRNARTAAHGDCTAMGAFSSFYTWLNGEQLGTLLITA
jgi:hypothetical protein